MTHDDIETEYWAVHYLDPKNSSGEEIEDDDFDLDAEMAEINARAEEAERQREAAKAPPDPGDWEDI